MAYKRDHVIWLAYRFASWQQSRKTSQQSAIRESRLWTWRASLVHLFGLASTGLILYLSLSNSVFARTDDHSLSAKLNAMQFAAAVHAAILTLSLSFIMAALVCYEMCVKQGVPSGMIAAAHQLSSPEILFSRDFWTKQSSYKKANIRQIWLRVALCAAIIMTALLGPSSAVLLVPQVGWSSVGHPFANRDGFNSQGGPMPSFMAASYDILYPSHIDESWVPDSCDPSALNCREICPNAFMQGIATWCSQWVTNAVEPNISVTTATPVVRSLIASNPGLPPTGWSAATVEMLNLSRLAKTLWVWAQRSGSRLSTIASNPRIELIFNDQRPVLQPLVQVQCSKPVYIRSQTSIIVSFDYDRIVEPKSLPDSTRYPVNLTVDSSEWTARQAAQFKFVNLVNDTDRPALGALIGLSFTNYDPVDPKAIERALFPCTIDARWAPSALIYEPVVSNTVLSNFSDPGMLALAVFAAGRPVYIDASYGNALNSVIGSYSLNNLSYTVLEYNLRWFYNSRVGTVDHGFGEGTWQWMLATMISLQMAEALSRVNPVINGIVWIDKIKQAWDFCLNLEHNAWARTVNETLFTSPNEARAHPKQWTEINWKTEQYVYSWSLRQTPSYLAFIVIALHAAAVVSHFVMTWWKKWQCNAYEDMLGLITLAFQSPPPSAGEDASSNRGSGFTFADPIKMVESVDGKNIILSVGGEEVSEEEGTDKADLPERRLVPGKVYV